MISRSAARRLESSRAAPQGSDAKSTGENGTLLSSVYSSVTECTFWFDPPPGKPMIRPLSILAALAIAVPAFAQTKPIITPKDYGKWELLGASRLSPRGDWVAYAVNRVDEENQLRIRGGAKDTTIVVNYASGAAFTPDGKWVIYTIGVSPKDRE